MRAGLLLLPPISYAGKSKIPGWRSWTFFLGSGDGRNPGKEQADFKKKAAKLSIKSIHGQQTRK